MSRLSLLIVLAGIILASCSDRRYVQPMHTQSHHGHAVNIEYDVTLADTVVLLDESADIISVECTTDQIVVVKTKNNPVWPVGTVLVSSQRKCGSLDYIQHLVTKEPTVSVSGDHVELVVPVTAASPTECFKHAKITANLEQEAPGSKFDPMQMKDKEFTPVVKAFPSDKPLLAKGPYSMTCVDNGDDKGCSLSVRPKATFLLDIGFLKLNYFELSVNSEIAAQLKVRHYAETGYTGNFEHRIGDVNCAFGACWKWTLKVGPISATLTINLPTYAAVKINAGGKIDFVTKAKISMNTKFGLVYDGTWRTVFQNAPQMEFKVENVNSDANFDVSPSLQLGMSADISETARALISYNSYLAAKGSFVGGCDINVNGGMKVSHDSALEFKSILKFLNRKWVKDLFEKVLDFTKAVCPGLQNAIGNLEWKKGQKEAGAFANFRASAWFAPVMVLGAVGSVLAVAVVVMVTIKSRRTTHDGELYLAVPEE